jgi:hypothetical protein
VVDIAIWRRNCGSSVQPLLATHAHSLKETVANYN